MAFSPRTVQRILVSFVRGLRRRGAASVASVVSVAAVASIVYCVGMATRAPIKKPRPASGVAPTVRSTSPVWLWPSLRQAAVLLRVDPGTLSRRKVATEPYGQERRLAPTLVLELCDHYYRRGDIGELAGALVEHARPQAHSLDELESLEADVERYLTASRSAQRQGADDAWLTEAQRRLPKDVYQRVLEVVGGGEPVESFRGARFDEDDEG